MHRYYRLQIFDFLDASLKWEMKEREYKRRLAVNPMDISARQGLECIKVYRKALRYCKSYLTELQKDVLETKPYTREVGKRIKDVARKYNMDVKDLHVLRQSTMLQLRKLLESDFSKSDLDEYYDFEIRAFFRDSRKWEKEISTLQINVLSLLQLKGSSGDITGIRSTKISDTTGETADKVISLRKEIERRNTYIDIIKWIIRSLNQEEYDFICVYYGKVGVVNRQSIFRDMENDEVGYKRDRLCEKYFYSEGTADRKRRLLDEKIKRKIVAQYVKDKKQ